MASEGDPGDGVDRCSAKPAAVSRSAIDVVADRKAVSGALERLRALQARQLAARLTGSHEDLRRMLEEGRD